MVRDSSGMGGRDVTYAFVVLALGWIAPDAAAPVAKPQISFEADFEVYEGEEWRSKLHHDLVPVAHQGMATVWTLEETKLAQLRGFTKETHTLPKVTAFENTDVDISDVSNRHYVAWSKLLVTGDKAEYKPKTVRVEEGLRIKLAGRCLDQGVLAKVNLDYLNFRGFSTVSVKEPSSQAGKPLDAKDNVYQRPYIDETHVSGEWLIPSDSVLVVGLGAVRGKDAPTENLVVIRPRRVLSESEERAAKRLTLPTTALAAKTESDSEVRVTSHPVLDSVQPPAALKNDDAPVGVQPAKVVNDVPSQTNPAQITYETRVAIFEGTAWRSKLHHDLVLLSHKGKVSVWTLEASKLPSLESFSSDPLLTPTLSTTEGVTAVVSTVKPRHFVSWMKMILAGGQVAFQPITDKFDEGIEVQMRGSVLDQGILSKVKIDYLDFLGYSHIEVKGPKKVEGKKVNLLSHSYQIPSIYEAHIEGEWLIPHDRVLVVGLGIERGAENKLSEKLVVIKPRKAMPESDGKTASPLSTMPKSAAAIRNSAPVAAVATNAKSDSQLKVTANEVQVVGQVPPPVAPVAVQGPVPLNLSEAKKEFAKRLVPDEVIGVDFDFEFTTDGRIALDMGKGAVVLNLSPLFFSQANSASSVSKPVASNAGTLKPAPMPSRSTPVAVDSTGVVLPPLPGDSKVIPAAFDASGKPLASAQAGHVVAESSENRPMIDKALAKASIPQHSEINIFQGAASKAPKQIFAAGAQLDPAKLVQLEEQTIKIPVAKGLAIELKARLIPDAGAAKPAKLLNDAEHRCELGEDCDQGPCCEINKAKNR